MIKTRQNFGNQLRARREERGLTLADVAKQTKISLHALDCLEHGLFDELPGDVFVRGFLRSYARCVGLDAEDTVSDYGELMLSQEAAPSVAPVEVAGTRAPAAAAAAAEEVEASGDEPAAPEPITIKSITRAIVAAGDGTQRMPLKIAIAVLAVLATIAMALLMLLPPG